MDKKYKLIIAVCLTLLAIILFFQFLLPYILPFVIAVVLASLIDPAVALLEEKAQIPRGLAVSIILVIILIIISLLLVIAFSRIFIELDKLVDDIPDYKTLGEQINWLLQQNENVTLLIEELELPSIVREEIADNLQNIYNSFRDLIQRLFTNLLAGVRSLPHVIAVFFISIIATFFASKDKEVIIEYCLRPFPKDWQRMIKKLQEEIITAVVGFIRAQLILITNTTIISVLGLLIVGSDYAIVLSLLCGALDLIPVIGPSLVYIPWAIVSFIIGDIVTGSSLLVIYGVIAAVRQITEPKILGANIGVHPLATLMSLYVGVQLFGILGFIIGPALLIIIKAVLKSGIISFIV